MRMRVLVAATVALMLLASAALPQTEADSPTSSLSSAEHESLRKATALFIITLILILVMIVVLVVFSVMLRRRFRDLREAKPSLPTELEDLWWRMKPPEDSQDD